MIDINTFYLIDYENVGEGGLSNCSRLDKTDYIHIFYTGNTTHINLDILNNHGDAELITHKIPAGNQSVDMHLVSYLGYLIGTNKDRGCSYVIISNDKDFDNLVKFWTNETNDRIVKAARINPPATKQKNPIVQMPVKGSDSLPAKISAAEADQSVKKNAKDKAKDKTKMNHEVQKKLSGKGHNEKINEIAKIVCKYYGQDNFASNVHNALKQKYKNNYLEIYREIKPVIIKYGKL